jgi:hypothetical protein
MDVTCGDGATCNAGVYVEGQNATIDCGTGGACAGDIQCKAKTCKGTCDSTGITLCCSGANLCSSSGTQGCTVSDGTLTPCGG